MASSEKSKTEIGDVEDQIKQIRKDISKLTALLGDLASAQVEATKTSAKAEAENLLQRSREVADTAEGKVKDATESVESYIKEKPVQSALIALVIGILFGALSRR